MLRDATIYEERKKKCLSKVVLFALQEGGGVARGAVGRGVAEGR